MKETKSTPPKAPTAENLKAKLLESSFPVDYIEFHQATGLIPAGITPQVTWNDKKSLDKVEAYYHPPTATTFCVIKKTNKTFVMPSAGIKVVGFAGAK